VSTLTGITPEHADGDGLFGGIRKIFGSKSSKKSEVA